MGNIYELIYKLNCYNEKKNEIDSNMSLLISKGVKSMPLRLEPEVLKASTFKLKRPKVHFIPHITL